MQGYHILSLPPYLSLSLSLSHTHTYTVVQCMYWEQWEVTRLAEKTGDSSLKHNQLCLHQCGQVCARLFLSLHPSLSPSLPLSPSVYSEGCLSSTRRSSHLCCVWTSWGRADTSQTLSGTSSSEEQLEWIRCVAAEPTRVYHIACNNVLCWCNNNSMQHSQW